MSAPNSGGAGARRSSGGPNPVASTSAHNGPPDFGTLAAKLSDPGVGKLRGGLEEAFTWPSWVAKHSMLTPPRSLLSTAADTKSKIGVASELRDSVDFYQRDMDPAKFFDVLLPGVMAILANGKPSLVNLSPDNVSIHPFLPFKQWHAADKACGYYSAAPAQLAPSNSPPVASR